MRKRHLVWMMLGCMALASAGCGKETDTNAAQETVIEAEKETAGAAETEAAETKAAETEEAETEAEETEAAETETEETAEETEAEAEETEAAEETLDTIVTDIIVEHNRSIYLGEECPAEGHIILDYEEQDDTTTVYALTTYGEYQFQNVDYIVKAAGSGVIPAVLTITEDEATGEREATVEWPEDGSGYNASIKSMFPEELWERTLSIQEEDREALIEMEQNEVEQYLEQLGRDAVIAGYSDMEYQYLTDCGISVDVSNKMMSYEAEMEGYPSWVGSCEKLEDGERYLYSLSVDEEQGRIVYEKRHFDSGETAEQFVYDSETGEKIG